MGESGQSSVSILHNIVKPCAYQIQALQVVSKPTIIATSNFTPGTWNNFQLAKFRAKRFIPCENSVKNILFLFSFFLFFFAE